MKVISLQTILINICIVILCFTIIRSILIMIVGKHLFSKAKINVKSAYYPILNLFTLLEITDTPLFYGILFFIPILNLIPLILSSYKLGKTFNVSKKDLIGLMFLPIVFYPLVCKKDYKYKVEDEKYFEALENVKTDSVLLLSQEEIEELNKQKEEKEEVDSIFKSEVQMMEEVEPYRAISFDNENNFENINSINNLNNTNSDNFINDINNINSTTSINNKNDFEIVDLNEPNNTKNKDNLEIIDL